MESRPEEAKVEAETRNPVRDSGGLCHSASQQNRVLRKSVPSRSFTAKPKAPIHLLGTCRLRQAPPSGPLPTTHMELSEEMKEMGRAWAIHGPGGTGI